MAIRMKHISYFRDKTDAEQFEKFLHIIGAASERKRCAGAICVLAFVRTLSEPRELYHHERTIGRTAEHFNGEYEGWEVA